MVEKNLREILKFKHQFDNYYSCFVSQVQSPSESNHDLSSYGDINSQKIEVGDDDECDDDDNQNTGGKRARKGEKCPYCNKSLPNAQRLTAHLTKVHDNVSNRYECQNMSQNIW